MLLKIRPVFVLWAFKKMRAGEISFILPSSSGK